MLQCFIYSNYSLQDARRPCKRVEIIRRMLLYYLWMCDSNVRIFAIACEHAFASGTPCRAGEGGLFALNKTNYVDEMRNANFVRCGRFKSIKWRLKVEQLSSACTYLSMEVDKWHFHLRINVEWKTFHKRISATQNMYFSISLYLRILPSLLLHPFNQSPANVYDNFTYSVHSGFNSIVIISSGHLKIEVPNLGLGSKFLQIAINNWNVSTNMYSTRAGQKVPGTSVWLLPTHATNTSHRRVPVMLAAESDKQHTYVNRRM